MLTATSADEGTLTHTRNDLSERDELGHIVDREGVGAVGEVATERITMLSVN